MLYTIVKSSRPYRGYKNLMKRENCIFWGRPVSRVKICSFRGRRCDRCRRLPEEWLVNSLDVVEIKEPLSTSSEEH